MKTFKLFLILLSVFIMAGCGSEKNNTYDNVDQMLSKAQADIAIVKVTDLKAVQKHKGDYKIIDCRETSEFTKGHIPGAINIPRGVLEFSDKISNRRETIYIYSQTNNRASLAYPSLKLLKYNKVYLIDGGWQQWHKTFPELIEKGDGGTEKKPTAKVEASGGCG